MKNLIISQKIKLVIWKIIVIIALFFLGLMDVLLINMFQSHITDVMSIMTVFVWLFFISGLILRLIQLKKIIFPFIVIGDMYLIIIMFIQNGFPTDFLREVFLEPIYLLNMLIIFILIWDWKKRFVQLDYNVNNKKHCA